MVCSLVAGLSMALSRDSDAGRGTGPAPESNLSLSAPIATWDEGIPIGNGLTGGLLWGGGSQLNVSLDRGDLWDERPAKGMQWDKFTNANLVRMVQARDRAGIDDIFERAYYDVHPSKLPGGRLVIDLGPRQVQSFGLDLKGAEGQVQLATGGQIRAWWLGRDQVGRLWVPGSQPVGIKLMTPGMVATQGSQDVGPDSRGVGLLGYPPAKFGEEEGLYWYDQEAAEGLRYVVMAGVNSAADGQHIVTTITSTADGPDPVAVAKQRLRAALARPLTAVLKDHQAWWSDFWATSGVRLPEAHIQRQYDFVRYLYGSGSRRGAPPMPLQGVWTADAGSLPPWKGDYHNDLNTQMTYMGYQGAGQWDAGLSYLDFLWERRPRFQRFAREFYGTKGLSTPGVMTLSGEPLAGWVQYSLSPTMTAWSAHLFYLHWRYTVDDEFLRTRAYPWCREAGECIAALLKPDASGRLVLPTSSSPEIFDNSDRAWLKPNSNYDLMSIRMLFLSLVEMATAVGDKAEAAKWQRLSDGLGDYHVRKDGTLRLNSEEDLPGSHRHLSNLMGLHPFNLIHPEGTYEDRRRIRASLAEWESKGTQGWVGYSFSWMSALQARMGNAEEAHRLLDIYARAFVLRNGFHANGDQTDEGHSGFRYRPFTLEGNFLAMNAVHEMLLQSWSPTPGKLDSEVIRVFPAVPAAWRDVEFNDLRAEGGYRVSARRRNGVTVHVKVVASRAGTLRIRNDFDDRFAWLDQQPRSVGPNLVFTVAAGEVVEGVITE